jgi:hypothetical protein
MMAFAFLLRMRTVSDVNQATVNVIVHLPQSFVPDGVEGILIQAFFA